MNLYTQLRERVQMSIYGASSDNAAPWLGKTHFPKTRQQGTIEEYGSSKPQHRLFVNGTWIQVSGVNLHSSRPLHLHFRSHAFQNLDGAKYILN